MKLPPFIHSSFFIIFLLLIVCVPTILPLLHPGFYTMHDDIQVQRVYEMGKSLADGMFPVRWVADLGFGYGYPIFNFYAPLAYYFGGILVLFSMDALVATKVMIGVGVLLSGITMYYLVKEFFGKSGGFLAAVFYVYAPYHALDVYVRGDTAEFWAYAFIPLVFLGIYKTYQTSQKRWIVIGGLGFAAIILSHNLTALMVTPFLLITCGILMYISFRNKSSASYYLLLLLLLGVGFSCFYWLPALTEMKYTMISMIVGGSSDFHMHFVCPLQLWTSPWGYGGSAPGCIDGISFKIGKIHIIFALLALLSYIVFFVTNKKRELHEEIKIVAILLAGAFFAVSVFLTLDVSKLVWELIKPLSFLQFPWRFLLLSSFFASFLAGGFLWLLLYYLNKLNVKILTIPLILGILVFLLGLNAKLFVPERYVNFSSEHYLNPFLMKWIASKTSFEYMPPNFKTPTNPSVLLKQPRIELRAQNVEIFQKTQKTIIKGTFLKPSKIVFTIARFPSWNFFLDGKHIVPKTSFDTYSIDVPQGTHLVVVSFKRTLVQLIGDVVSLASIIAVILVIILSRRWKILHA